MRAPGRHLTAWPPRHSRPVYRTERAGSAQFSDSYQFGSRIKSAPRGLVAQRAGKIISLAKLAAEFPKLGELAGRLHAFGDHVETEALGEGDDRPHDLRVLAAGADPGDEGAVDLERVEGELMEVAERRVALAEIVEGELDARATSAGSATDDADSTCSMMAALGDLHLQAVGVEARLQQDALDLVDQIGLEELPARQVDADRQRAGSSGTGTASCAAARPRLGAPTGRSAGSAWSPRPAG